MIKKIKNLWRKKEILPPKLVEIRKKLYSSYPRETPENEIENEIYIELDLLTTYLSGELSNTKEYPPFQLQSEKERAQSINELIKKRGEKEFQKNTALAYCFDVCLEAIKLMEEYNKKNYPKFTFFV